MYAARYRAFAVGGSTQEGALVVYRAPGTGFRIDLVGAIELDGDQEMDEIMKGGDILIVINDIKDQSSFQMYSCRTQRRSCRTADGLEILGFVSILSYFSYPLPAVYEQPHTVEEVERISAAGEEARCFLIREKDPDAEKTQPPGLGVVVGEGLPVTLCYTKDGIPLRFGEVQDGVDAGLEATEIVRSVDESVFDLPFEFVPSVYDDE